MVLEFTVVGTKLYRGGGGGAGEGHNIEKFFELRYFLRLQKPFSRKVGGGGGHMPPAPRFLRHWNYSSYKSLSCFPKPFKGFSVS